MSKEDLKERFLELRIKGSNLWKIPLGLVCNEKRNKNSTHIFKKQVAKIDSFKMLGLLCRLIEWGEALSDQGLFVMAFQTRQKLIHLWRYSCRAWLRLLNLSRNSSKILSGLIYRGDIQKTKKSAIGITISNKVTRQEFIFF